MSNFICPQCGETNIDSPDGYVKGCECLKSDTECLPMSKQLEDAAYDEHWPFSQGMGETEDREGYFFTPDQFQTYRTQLLKEQREICAEAYTEARLNAANHGIDTSPQMMWERIKNAPEP